MWLGDPIIGTLREGVSLAITPEVTDKSWRVRFRGSFSAVVRPIPLHEATLAGKTVEIQLPEMRLIGFDESFEVDGQAAWFLVGTPVAWSDVKGRAHTTRVVLVRIDRARLQSLQLAGVDEEETK